MKAKRNNTAIWVSAISLVALIVLFFLFWNNGYNWYDHSYDREDDEPYGADLTFNYLESIRSEEDFSVLDSTIAQNLAPYLGDSVQSNYIVFGWLPILDSLSKEHLFQYVSEGNNAFLLSGAVPTALLEEWHDGECVLYKEEPDYNYYFDPDLLEESPGILVDSMVQVNFTHPQLMNEEGYEFGHYVKDELKTYPWPFLDKTYFCENNTSLTSLGTIDEHVNFFRVPFGAGYFYVHTNPKLFTNFYLLTEDGKDYADKVFAHLGDGPIIWDDKKWKSDLSPEYYKERYFQNEGPLSYLLSQESLRNMLYLLFAMVILFFLLGSKRKQRAIPVLRQKENSSMEYVDTISDLYFNQGGDGRIFRYISDQFQFFIRKRYRFSFKWRDEQTWGVLAKASGIPIDHVKDIIAIHSKGAYEPNVDDKMLTEYYRLIEHFYTNCK
ncbi:MAG: hypothetical protein HKN45_02835 [Flavobacteriales bacterium]|nr:hypothetical protein [Flavobacteriales bacterium]